MFTIALLSATLEDSTAGVLCNPAWELNCKPVVEYLPLKENGKLTKAVPVTIAYVHDFAKDITLSSYYPTIAHLEDDVDRQVIDIFAKFTADNEYLNYLRETGEVINKIRLIHRVHIEENKTSFPYNDFTFIYKGLILPSGSLIVLRRVVFEDYDIPTIDPNDYRLSDSVLEKSDTSAVILHTGADFWKDYFAYYKDRTSKGLYAKKPLEYFKEDWKKLPKRVRNVSLPPIFLIKNGKLLAMRGKTVYHAGEFTESHLKRIKTSEDWYWEKKDSTGKVVDSISFPKGTDLLTIYKALKTELDKEGKYTDKALFISRAVAKTLLQTDREATLFFNFDAGYAYLADEDGLNTYAIVYAGTPKVLEYKATNDPHYTEYGMDDPTKIYWNDPFRNAVVVPERVACLYYAGENCKRFKVYKPASKHSATNVTLRYYYYKVNDYLKEKYGVILGQIDYRDRYAVINAIKKAMWSEKVELPDYFYTYSVLNLKEKVEEAFKEEVEKPLVLTSRSYADENYVLTCDVSNSIPEALFKIPEEFKDEAVKAGGTILQENGDVAVYFDAETRLPIPSVTCEELKEQVDEPVLELNNAPPIPDFILKEMENYVEEKTEGTEKVIIINTPAIGGQELEGQGW
jgi:hypothetical protein